MEDRMVKIMGVNRTINQLRILVNWVNEEGQLVELDDYEIKTLNDSLNYLIEQAEKVERYEKALESIKTIIVNESGMYFNKGETLDEIFQVVKDSLKN